MNSTDNSQNTPAGEMPPGRPPQTDFNAVFDNDLDYPRLGNVTFRRGTLTDNQHQLFEQRWPELGRVLSDELIDVAEWFGRTGAKTIVEIGSGTGTSTAAMAPLEQDTNIIAVELYKPGLAKLMGQIEREGIDNIRMIRGDGVEVMVRMIAPESLDGIRVFFPDPWPKARHHKRRIIQSGTLNLFASRLKKGGVLHVATDHAGYAEWIDELVHVEPSLEYKGWPWPDCPQLVDRQIITKFEGKGLDKEHVITEYLWEKK
ncbi:MULTISPECIES: tRNA (guanosine(46)-N7)-methyltransferase TrmB [unclassified Corynebacterium]|uniref:tRNA (guanosine(46)-N7)-methyltransferase TrmB n=1 Tax=Corynebacterium TaxID=1716 RepID=UPI00254CAAA2|nr:MULTISPECIES: tRNA (guanosine(46)-N7)-methyltransferase TrmB [unclassified Corynebacterium]MDK8453712.1 tRNA (guanosine(46)-N7)-methyltransferase TrmB [Corynebacterium sp. MSK084]MDK8468112.1 tRNA (guanosine(46)-N7)-methyltransferase TrmB [Corynebacterium sp. MSK130]MDK8477052.1 tRNA (guanosine(46)-N7)-methyltransferase TrmB [Corynebacterium sp. MSK310]MDK8492370.1 tRNA (guanosine(46)-N7)-methyltransferase TrmB [Corynebacterium sp. MSK175]MDK8515645.1 tRNA (guanosine(46)-N7)-methyltransfera